MKKNLQTVIQKGIENEEKPNYHQISEEIDKIISKL